MKTEWNEPGNLVFTKGDSWVRFAFYGQCRKVGVTQDETDGVPKLGPKNLDTLAAWATEAGRQIKAKKKLRKQTDSDRLDNS